jgi:ribonuclease BN (tRNA processing enzyme)
VVSDQALSVTVLGCSGTYAGPGGACSGYLVRGGGATVLLDAGPGVLANLQQHVRPDELDAVVVSHSHPDHWMDVPVMRNALTYVFAHAGVPTFSTAETLGLLEGVFHGRIGDSLAPQVVTDGSEFAVGPLRFRCSRTDHPPETLGVRVDLGERSLGYSADTGPGWSLAELGPDLDLGISEATFLDSEGPHGNAVHLTAGEAGGLARSAGVGRLVITHVLPLGSVDEAVAEASEAYGSAVDAARLHRTYQV